MCFVSSLVGTSFALLFLYPTGLRKKFRSPVYMGSRNPNLLPLPEISSNRKKRRGGTKTNLGYQFMKSVICGTRVARVITTSMTVPPSPFRNRKQLFACPPPSSDSSNSIFYPPLKQFVMLLAHPSSSSSAHCHICAASTTEGRETSSSLLNHRGMRRRPSLLRSTDRRREGME